jgi:hypothetical protein
MKLMVKMVTASLLLGSGSAMGALFSEDFNDGLAATRWSVVSQQEGVVGPDGSVDFAFDYSTLGIANPGGGADTTGVFLQFNKTDDGPVDEGESYSIFPNGQSFSGDIALELDMFVYNDGGGGSTEHGMAGLFLENNSPVSPYEFGAVGGPLAWVYSGEGGDGTGDLGKYAEGGLASTGYSALGDYNAVPTGTIPGFETGASGSLGPAAPPNDRGSWVKVRIEAVGSTINWLLNGTVVDTYDNSGGFYTSGNILVGGMDVFNSANGANGVIVDNVVVTPEPATLGLLLAGGLSMLRRARRA